MGEIPEDPPVPKARLRRLDVLFPRNPVFFITACTFERKPILRQEAIHQAFVDFARKAGGLGHWVGPYVLMPDHLHAFVAPADTAEDGLSRWVKSMKNRLSKA